MYRIKFIASGAYWAIQFCVWEMFWASVKAGVKREDGKVVLDTLKFDTYEDAEKYVSARGIDKVYPCKSPCYVDDTQPAAANQVQVYRMRGR